MSANPPPYIGFVANANTGAAPMYAFTGQPQPGQAIQHVPVAPALYANYGPAAGYAPLAMVPAAPEMTLTNVDISTPTSETKSSADNMVNGEPVVARAEFDIETVAGWSEDCGWGSCCVLSILCPCLCPCITIGLHPWARREETRNLLKQTDLVLTANNLVYRTPNEGEQVIPIKSISEIKVWSKSESGGKYVIPMLAVFVSGSRKPILERSGVANAEAFKNAIFEAQRNLCGPAQPSAPSLAAELQSLAALHDKGTISEEEFAAAKRKLLS